MTDTTNFKLVMLPAQTAVTREWAARLKAEIPGIGIATPENADQAWLEMFDADACYGMLTPPLLAAARQLRWLQAPFAAPPAGFYYPELVEHEVVVTNLREIYNDHISAHIVAFVLVFARGLDVYLAQQLRIEWRPEVESPPIHRVASATSAPGVWFLIVGRRAAERSRGSHRARSSPMPKAR